LEEAALLALITLTDDYPSEQTAAATAQDALDDVEASCSALLEYGTTAEIKQQATADVQTMWGYRNTASQS
jgi:hypothetical protein